MNCFHLLGSRNKSRQCRRKRLGMHEPRHGILYLVLFTAIHISWGSRTCIFSPGGERRKAVRIPFTLHFTFRISGLCGTRTRSHMHGFSPPHLDPASPSGGAKLSSLSPGCGFTLSISTTRTYIYYMAITSQECRYESHSN